jgi:hypothetical protein
LAHLIARLAAGRTIPYAVEAVNGWLETCPTANPKAPRNRALN